MLEAGVDHDQTIILIHGLGNTASKIWEELIPQLAQEYHVIAFDLPGFGRSEAKNMLYSPKNYSKLLSWIVKKYAKKEHSVIGHSLGGSIALMYAATKPPTLKKLILVDVAGILHRSSVMEDFFKPTIKERTPGFPPPLSDAVDSAIGAATHLAGNAGIDTEFILNSALLRKTLLGNNPSKIASLALIETNFSPVVFKPTCPTLILWGEKDKTSPLRIGYLLKSSLPNSHLEILKDAGHSPMQKNTKNFNRIVIEFLSASTATEKSNTSTQKLVANGRADQTISGDFLSVELTNCQNMTLRNLRTKNMALNSSSATLENISIKGNGRGLFLKNSRVRASGMKIDAPQALVAERSRGDLAGIDISGAIAPITSDKDSYLLFSTSRIKTSKKVQYLHGPWSRHNLNPHQ